MSCFPSSQCVQRGPSKRLESNCLFGLQGALEAPKEGSAQVGLQAQPWLGGGGALSVLYWEGLHTLAQLHGLSL